MIREEHGDLVRSNADCICHQTNYFGSMGGGVAYAIWTKLLEDKAKDAYVTLCRDFGRSLLGTIQPLPFVRERDGHAGILINMFCQDEEVQEDGSITRYDCMRRCLNMVEVFARQHRQRVAIPGYIGCGIAGGDWGRVKQIIIEVFEQSPVELTIVYWDRGR